MNNIEPWFVLGAGAMGGLITQSLQEEGLDAQLLHHRAGSARRRIVQGDREYHLLAQCLTDLPHNSISRLLITTKAARVGAALALAMPFLTPNAVVAATANGLGFEREFHPSCKALTVHRAVSTAAAFRPKRDTVVIAAQGLTRIGAVDASQPAPLWFEDSLTRLPGWNWESPINQALGQKFSINCMINALTAVQGCRNGALLTGEKAGPKLQALCAESEAALIALGLWPQNRSLLSATTGVCRDTADNQSSMLQDVLAERPTEIAYLNTELLRRANELGMELPLNCILVQELSP